MMRSPARWRRGFAVTIAIASRQTIWRILLCWTNRVARSTNCRRCSGCRASIRFSAVEAPERSRLRQRWRSRDAITAAALRYVERRIRSAQKIIDRRSGGRIRGHAEAGAQRNGSVGRLHVDGLDAYTYALRRSDRRRGVRLGQDREKFVTAPPPDHVTATRFFLREHGGRCERAIAGGMAVAIVDRLEAIEIEHDDRVAMMVALRVRVRLLELVRQPSAIVQAGQRIVRRLPMELRSQFRLRERRFRKAREGRKRFFADPLEVIGVVGVEHEQ